MAQPSSLLRFQVELSDVDRGVYETIDFRVAKHPSETNHFLLSRVFAYLLNFEDELNFAPGGLSDTEDPALAIEDPRGGFRLCIEIGSPSTRRLHKAMKLSSKVKVYTYKDPRSLLAEIRSGDIYNVEELEVFSFNPKFLDQIAENLARDNKWVLLLSSDVMTLSIGSLCLTGEVTQHNVSQVD